jgi:hypothetical protein
MSTDSFDNLRRDALKAKTDARQYRTSNHTQEFLRLTRQALELHCAAAAIASTSKEKGRLLGAAAVLALRLEERDLACNLVNQSLAKAPRPLKHGLSRVRRLIIRATQE